MAKRQKVTYPRRGEIYLVDFEPTRGAEIKKTRPALIIENDTGNRYSPITIVAVITSQVGGRIYPTEVFLKAPEGGLTSGGLVLLNQIRSIDKGRLVKWLGTITPQTVQRVEDALRISMEL